MSRRGTARGVPRGRCGSSHAPAGHYSFPWQQIAVACAGRHRDPAAARAMGGRLSFRCRSAGALLERIHCGPLSASAASNPQGQDMSDGNGASRVTVSVYLLTPGRRLAGIRRFSVRYLLTPGRRLRPSPSGIASPLPARARVPSRGNRPRDATRRATGPRR